MDIFQFLIQNFAGSSADIFCQEGNKPFFLKKTHVEFFVGINHSIDLFCSTETSW